MRKDNRMEETKPARQRLECMLNDSPEEARWVVVQIPYEHISSKLPTSLLANRAQIRIDF